MIETKRLILRRWTDADLDPFTELCSDSEVMRYIGRGETLTRAQCEATIERFERGWGRHGTSVLAAERRDTGRFIGFVGLAVPEFLPEILPAVEIGWRLKREEWGQGLATEGAVAALRWGFKAQRLTQVVSIIQVGNTASCRVAEKLGMSPSHETVHPGTDRKLSVYTIDRPTRPTPTAAAKLT